MSNFQNLRNRRYYISGHQVSRSVSKSSGTIGSTRIPQEKNDSYIVYMYTCEMHIHIHEGFKTIPRNDTKTIPISDPFGVFWCFPQVPRKTTPSSKLFSLLKTIWGRCTEVRRSFPLEWPGRTALEKSYFRRSYYQKDSTTTLTSMTKEPYFHIGIINLVQTLKNDRVHKKNDTRPLMSFSVLEVWPPLIYIYVFTFSFATITISSYAYGS